jgi:dCTP deaminase
MVLGDSDIAKLFQGGYLLHSDLKRINPASLNVRIGATFLVPRRTPFGIALGGTVMYKRVEVRDGACFRLRPGQFALATTIEEIRLPRSLVAFVQGRSSIGRAGLAVQNAGYVDPGFHGHITLELKNETRNSIYIRPGYPVAQLVFEEASNVEKPYAGKYNGQVEATGSRMYMDADALRFHA